jgi:NADPH:quinone reductase-like Zn-dependent oxidoreductase
MPRQTEDLYKGASVTSSFPHPSLSHRSSNLFNKPKSSETTTMSNQAWQIASPGHLVLATTGPPPTPGPNEILVRIHAMSLNYRDILVADHSPDYPLLAKPNLIPGSDGAGIVESAGSASHWKSGDRVVLFPHTWLSGSPRNYVFDQTLGGAERDGTFQKFMLIDEKLVVKAPESMSLGEASTLFTAGVTAWNALCYGDEEGNGVEILKGKTVLTQGTGGVSCYAIQVSSGLGDIVDPELFIRLGISGHSYIHR